MHCTLQPAEGDRRNICLEKVKTEPRHKRQLLFILLLLLSLNEFAPSFDFAQESRADVHYLGCWQMSLDHFPCSFVANLTLWGNQGTLFPRHHPEKASLLQFIYFICPLPFSAAV